MRADQLDRWRDRLYAIARRQMEATAAGDHQADARALRDEADLWREICDGLDGSTHPLWWCAVDRAAADRSMRAIEAEHRARRLAGGAS